MENTELSQAEIAARQHFIASRQATKKADITTPAQARDVGTPSTTKVDPRELRRAIDSSRQRLHAQGTDVGFSYDKDLDLLTIKVVDPKNGELIRQIPPLAFIRIAESTERLLGLLVDERR